MRSLKKSGTKGSQVVTPGSQSATKPSGDEGDVKNKTSNKQIKCVVRLLDDTQDPLNLTLAKDDLGQRLFSTVCNEIGDLVECDYFGLRYTDKFWEEQWIDLSRSVYKQMKGCKSNELYFRLKHYPLDPIADLKQNFTRYLVYLQIRRDLTHGRLLCPSNMMSTVGALVAQAELGDAPLEEVKEHSNNCQTTDHESNEEKTKENTSTDNEVLTRSSDSSVNYIKDLNIFESQTPEMEAEIMKKHQQLRGLTVQEAESELLNRVSKFPTYGIHPFLVVPHHRVVVPPSPTASPDENAAQTKLKRSKSSPNPDSTGMQPVPKGTNFYLDVTGNGLVFYAGLKRIQEYPWGDIHRLRCDGKQFIVNLKRGEPHLAKRFFQHKSRQLTFDCTSQSAALALWRWTVDRKCFFTLKEAKQAKRLRPSSNIFHRSNSYRFCGRSFQELSTIPITNSKDDFIRVASLRHTTRPVSAFPGHSTLPDRLRPKLDMTEHLEKDEKTDQVKVQLDSAEVEKSIDIPETVIEQPIQEESSVVTDEANVEESKIIEAPEEVKGCVDETTIEAKQVPQQLLSPSTATATTTTTTTTLNDGLTEDKVGQEIRNRVDSNLIHNVVYEQVVSALDLTIDDHVNNLNGPTNHTTEAIPNGSVHQNGATKGTLNGPIRKKQEYSKKPKNEEQKSSHVSDDLKKDSLLATGTKASVTVVVVVMLIGLITILETTPDTDSSALRFIRSNAFISGLDSYVYSPMRNAILAGLSFIWS